jgi:hypothetical protein
MRLFIIVLLGCFLMACNGYLGQYGSAGGRGRKLPYHVSHEVHTCVQGKISGHITRLKPETFSLDMEPGLAMEVQTPDQGLVHIHLGPLWFLERQEHDLKPGDEVTIQVFCYTLAGKERLLAGEVKHKDHTIVLRDPQGQPYWDASRK